MAKSMFKCEADMASAAMRWMQAQGLTVKSEFISPWGICDLVGLSFKKKNVARRLAFGQSRAITSLTRAALLLRIPDIATHNSITIHELIDECSPAIPSEVVRAEAHRLEQDSFVVRSRTDCLQKVNGWMPLQKRLVAVELKLQRIEEAMLQAENNCEFAKESYVGLPKELAVKLGGKSSRRKEFKDRGIGLLAITPDSCEIIFRAPNSATLDNPVVQFYCVEKFWRSYATKDC